MNVSNINGLMKDTIAQMKTHHPTPGIVFCKETGLMYQSTTLVDGLSDTNVRIKITGYTDKYWVSPDLGDSNLGPLDPTREYETGDRIRYGNIYLKANGPIGPISNILIGTEANRWSPCWFTQDETVEDNFQGSWQSSNNYNVNDFIYAGDGLFLICTQDHTSSSAANFNDAVYNPGATDTSYWRAYFRSWPSDMFHPEKTKATVIQPGLVPKLPADPNLALKSDGEWGAVIEGFEGSKTYPANALTFFNGIQWKSNGETSTATLVPGTTGATWKPIVSGADVPGYRGLWRNNIAYTQNDVVLNDDADMFAVCLHTHGANVNTPFQALTTSNAYNWYVGSIKMIGAVLIAAQNIMVGAQGPYGGRAGMVPAPEAGQHQKALRGNGTWGTPIFDYAASNEYRPGDEVVYQGQVFVANDAIPANTTFELGETGATWRVRIGEIVIMHEDTGDKYRLRLNTANGLYLRKYGLA